MLSKSFTSVCRDRPYGGKGGNMTFYEFVKMAKENAEKNRKESAEKNASYSASLCSGQVMAYELMLESMPVAAASAEI